jgi:hypothetical protein
MFTLSSTKSEDTKENKETGQIKYGVIRRTIFKNNQTFIFFVNDDQQYIYDTKIPPNFIPGTVVSFSFEIIKRWTCEEYMITHIEVPNPETKISRVGNVDLKYDTTTKTLNRLFVLRDELLRIHNKINFNKLEILEFRFDSVYKKSDGSVYKKSDESVRIEKLESLTSELKQLKFDKTKLTNEFNNLMQLYNDNWTQF